MVSAAEVISIIFSGWFAVEWYIQILNLESETNILVETPVLVANSINGDGRDDLVP